MELLKVLTMPFQWGSLLFVAASSLLLGLLLALASFHPMLLIWLLAPIWLMLVWLTNYSLRLIDDAANGVRESAAASAEMMADTYLDSRAWVHPLIAVGLAVMHWRHPQWPVAPTLAAGALLLPASLGACTMTGRARDALNPLMIWRVIRGLGPWYLPLVGFIALCVLLGTALASLVPPGAALVASVQLLLLIVYSATGGAIYQRRLELGFDARISPEREAEKVEAARVARRQEVLDGMYKDLRVRQWQRALDSAREWLASTRPSERMADVNAIVAAGRSWTQVRDHALLLQGLISMVVEMKQPGLACTLAEAGLAVTPEFRAKTEGETVALIVYALETGRRRTAARLLENFLGRADAGFVPGPRLAALRDRIRSIV